MFFLYRLRCQPSLYPPSPWIPGCQLGVWGKDTDSSLDKTNVCIAITLSFVDEFTYNIICLAWQKRWHFVMPPVVFLENNEGKPPVVLWMSVFSGYYLLYMSKMSFISAFFHLNIAYVLEIYLWIPVTISLRRSELVGADMGEWWVVWGPGRVSAEKRKPPKCKSTKNDNLGRGILQNAECRMALFSEG